MNSEILPPFHIELGLMNKWCCLLTTIYSISSSQFCEAQGTQIRETKDKIFEEILTLKELRLWEAFMSVFNGFFVNTRLRNYQDLLGSFYKLL